MQRKTSFLSFCLVVLFATSISAQYNKKYDKLVWAEEFNYTGAPNPKIWNYELGYIRNNEAQHYTDNAQNICVKDGCLVIEALFNENSNPHYTSASINTLMKKHFKYGRIEIRAKIPQGRGIWPAIWMLGADIRVNGFPECGELDIMENVGYEPNRFYSTVHTPGSLKDASQVKQQGIKETDPTQFHTFAMERYKNEIKFFVDEECVLTYPKNKELPDYWKFNKPFYLLINLAVGGGWGGRHGIDNSIFPAKYYVDWVRLYK